MPTEGHISAVKETKAAPSPLPRKGQGAQQQAPHLLAGACKEGSVPEHEALVLGRADDVVPRAASLPEDLRGAPGGSAVPGALQEAPPVCERHPALHAAEWRIRFCSGRGSEEFEAGGYCEEEREGEEEEEHQQQQEEERDG